MQILLQEILSLKMYALIQGALSKMLELTQSPAESSAAAEPAEFDPLRDGPLRYLGYANECGCAVQDTCSYISCC